MKVIFNKNEISYSLLDEKNIEEIIALLTEHFVKTEYLIKGCNFTYEEFEPFCRIYCEASIVNKLSIIALDDATGELVGYSINEDPNTSDSVSPDFLLDVSDKYHILFSVLNDLNTKFLNVEMTPGNSLHLYLLGVNPEFQGKGIGKTLVHVTEMVARDRGFNYILVEATSPGTKPICEKLGYESLGNIPYKDYEYKGAKIFSEITDYDGPYLKIKHLNKTKLNNV